MFPFSEWYLNYNVSTLHTFLLDTQETECFLSIIGLKFLIRQPKNSMLIGAKKLFGCRNTNLGVVFYNEVRIR